MLIVLALFLGLVSSKNISMTISSPELEVGAQSNCTIFLNRSKDVNGAAIQPS